jgi:hypothetical protein
MLAGERPRNLYKSRRPVATRMASAPVFFLNLEHVLDKRRTAGALYMVPKGPAAPDTVDLKTFDSLALTSTGVLRRLFLEEQAKASTVKFQDGVSRVMKDNTYTTETEAEVAAFHGSETSLLMKSVAGTLLVPFYQQFPSQRTSFYTTN